MSSIDAQVRLVVDRDVAPHVRAHLGGIEVDHVDGEGVAHVVFSGACEQCSYRRMTLLGAVLPRLAAIEGVTGVAATGVPISPAEQRRVLAYLGLDHTDQT